MGNTPSVQRNTSDEILGENFSKLQQIICEEMEHRESVEIQKLENIRTKLLYQGTVLSNILGHFTRSGDRKKMNGEVWEDCERILVSTVEKSRNLRERIVTLKKTQEQFSRSVNHLRTGPQALGYRVSHSRRGSAHF